MQLHSNSFTALISPIVLSFSYQATFFPSNSVGKQNCNQKLATNPQKCYRELSLFLQNSWSNLQQLKEHVILVWALQLLKNHENWKNCKTLCISRAYFQNLISFKDKCTKTFSIKSKQYLGQNCSAKCARVG